MIKVGLSAETAIILEGRKISYSELYASVISVSQQVPIPNKAHVAILSENSPLWIFAFFATWHQGATVVPIDFMSTGQDIAYILTDSKPSVVFTSKLQHEKLTKALEQVSFPVQVVVLDELKLESTTAEPAALHFGAAESSTAVIIYTSGTTSNPKGVMLSFGNLQANVHAVTVDVPIFEAALEVLLFLPLHHIFPLAGAMLAPLSVGGTIVISPTMEADDIRSTLSENKVKLIIGVPRFYELIYKSVKSQIDKSSIARLLYRVAQRLNSKSFSQKVFKKVHQALGGHVQYLVSGGAALPRDVGIFYKTMGFTVLEGYGMTEAAPMITFPRPGTERIGTTGQLLPGVELEIVENEIVVKGPNVMQGYLNQPEATAEVLKDGWLYTGDLGVLDKEGYLTITGRKKEIIVLDNGKNISPVELEGKIMSGFPQVKDIAVFLMNNQLHAAIVPAMGIQGDVADEKIKEVFRHQVLSVFNQQVASYKQIRQFTLLHDELPKTRLGKIKRFMLPQLVAQNEKKTAPKPSAEISGEFISIANFLKDQTGRDIHPNDHLEFDVALDSLGLLFLVDFLYQTFGVRVKQDQLQTFASVGDLAEFIAAKKRFTRDIEINWAKALQQHTKLKLPESWLTLPLISKLSGAIFRFFFRFKGIGVKNLPKGPVILAPNHQSFFDGLFVASLLKSRTMRSTYFYAKQKHVQNWFVRFMASKHNVIVMDLQKDLKESIQKLAMVLRNGKNVIIFPEGTRTTSGNLGDFKKTFAILSKELNIPVVPVAISGAYDAFSSRRFIPRLAAPIKVNFLSAIYPEGFTYESLTSKVHNEIQKVLKNANVHAPIDAAEPDRG